jgi:hypothetical protein
LQYLFNPAESLFGTADIRGDLCQITGVQGKVVQKMDRRQLIEDIMPVYLGKKE